MSNMSLKAYNTFRMDSMCEHVYAPLDLLEFEELLKTIENPTILGNGSNVLLAKDIPSSIILTSALDGITVTGPKVSVQCGVKAIALSHKVRDAELSGLEFLVGIPASLGGAVLMNAGAHGQCISDFLINVDVYDKEKEDIVRFKKEECEFSYRHSVFKDNPRYVVLGAEFELPSATKWEIQLRMDENTAFRKEKHPSLSTPNAGSVFKNPPNESAGRLLDECGVKGMRVGDAVVWDRHANFIVNAKNATSTDVSELMFSMYNKVKEKFGVELVPEILFIGEKNEVEEKIWNILLSQK